MSAVPKFRTPGELMPRFTVSWSLSVDANDPVDAADRAWRAAFLQSDRTAATLVKVTDAIGGESQIIDWVTHAVCGVPQPEPTKRYPLAKDVNTELLWRCQCCGSWDVQLSFPAWHDPNNGYAYVSTFEEADPTYYWCQHCEANSGRYIIRANDWDEEDVDRGYERHAAFWTAHPPGTAPVKPEEIPE